MQETIFHKKVDLGPFTQDRQICILKEMEAELIIRTNAVSETIELNSMDEITFVI